jgi:hypothetical protein
MEKYGFVYIWYDRKHKRYYIGCHWGTVDDRYICSSSNMKSAYKRRPNDFKRKILKTNIYDKKQLLTEEYNWLSLIKNEELGKKYYNLHNHHFNHWSTNESSKLTVGQKISKANKGDPKRSEWMKNRTISEETKEKIRQANLGKKYSDEVNMKKGINTRDYSDIEFRKKMSIAAKNRSEETRKKISENNKRLQAEGKIGMKGKKHSPETIEKMRLSALNRKLNIIKEFSQKE